MPYGIKFNPRGAPPGVDRAGWLLDPWTGKPKRFANEHRASTYAQLSFAPKQLRFYKFDYQIRELKS